MREICLQLLTGVDTVDVRLCVDCPEVTECDAR